MLVLSQFVLRLSFGLAAAMALTSPKKVTSGFFRNHAYVLLGVNVLATLAGLTDREHLLLWPPLVAAVLSYLCAAVWLYEKPRAGTLLLWGVAIVSLIGAWLTMPMPEVTHRGGNEFAAAARILWWLDPVTGGLLLGSTLAAMFLGHWYLNTPTMELVPLRKLVCLMATTVVVRSGVCALGLALQWHVAEFSTAQLMMLTLRWAAGLLGVGVLTWMSWQTLKIPNTQSATGILYVAVIGAFLGELCGLLLSAAAAFPL